MQYLLPLLLLAAVYAVILPRRRQAQAQRAAAMAAEPGDAVLIGGCIRGTLIAADERGARIEVAPGVVLDVMPRTFRVVDSRGASTEPTSPIVPSSSEPSSPEADGAGGTARAELSLPEPVDEGDPRMTPRDEET